MRLEAWANWWMSRRALALLALTTVLWFSSSRLSGRGQCERFIYEDGAWLPIDFPWVPRTHAGRAFATFLVSVTNVMAPVLDGLLLCVLVALLWTRLRPKSLWPLALMSIPALGSAMNLLAYGGAYAWEALGGAETEPLGQLGFWLWRLSEWAKPVLLAAVLLVCLGAFAHLGRMLNVRVRGSRSGT